MHACRSTLEDPTSTYFATVTAEYGVGSLTALAPVIVPEDAPTTIEYDAIENWLGARITDDMDAGVPDGGTAPLAGFDPNTVYLIFYPQETTITMQGSQSCQSFDGYHAQFTHGSGSDQVVYGVVNTCPGGFGTGKTQFQEVTVAAAHELIEAVTDPHPYYDPAYSVIDDDHQVWELMPMAELGDMCVSMDDGYIPTDLGYMVQRIWSNAAAAEMHDPCVPAAGGTYATALPILNESVPISLYQPGKTNGVKIAKGKSKTIDVVLYADGPIDEDLMVYAQDTNRWFGGDPSLELSFDKSTGKPGDVLKLTITRTANSQLGIGGDEFVLMTRSGERVSYFYGYVGD